MGMVSTGFPIHALTYKTNPTHGLIGRIAANKKTISVYKTPDYESDVVRETVFDELIHLYYEVFVKTEKSDALWYRVWGGYLPGKYVQRTKYKINLPIDDIDVCGRLAEITVPYTDAHSHNEYLGWDKKYRLYYGTNHWITGLKTGPDGNTWYELTSELSSTLKYYVRREHLRKLQDTEFSPTRTHIPPEEKLVKVSLKDQTLTAYEGQNVVMQTEISSGLGYEEVDPNDPNATATPSGTFHVTSKYPSKHMGSVIGTGFADSSVLPGVPWAIFFIFETGVAFHGTYWHKKMSHGCVNMRNRDAKWLFRWVTPPYYPPNNDRCDWDQTGYGTRISIF